MDVELNGDRRLVTAATEDRRLVTAATEDRRLVTAATGDRRLATAATGRTWIDGMWRIVLVAVVCIAMDCHCEAQPPRFPDIFGTAELEGVPSAAMLTERGRQLANELRNLRRSRNTMGAKHPSRPAVVERIKAIEEQLKAWAPASGDAESNPFKPSDAASGNQLGKPMQEANGGTPRLNEVDLQQLVLRLYRRIEELEKRIKALEER